MRLKPLGHICLLAISSLHKKAGGHLLRYGPEGTPRYAALADEEYRPSKVRVIQMGDGGSPIILPRRSYTWRGASRVSAQEPICLEPLCSTALSSIGVGRARQRRVPASLLTRAVGLHDTISLSLGFDVDLSFLSHSLRPSYPAHSGFPLPLRPLFCLAWCRGRSSKRARRRALVSRPLPLRRPLPPPGRGTLPCRPCRRPARRLRLRCGLRAAPAPVQRGLPKLPAGPALPQRPGPAAPRRGTRSGRRSPPGCA